MPALQLLRRRRRLPGGRRETEQETEQAYPRDYPDAGGITPALGVASERVVPGVLLVSPV
jgi:hypothetical protein